MVKFFCITAQSRGSSWSYLLKRFLFCFSQILPSGVTVGTLDQTPVIKCPRLLLSIPSQPISIDWYSPFCVSSILQDCGIDIRLPALIETFPHSRSPCYRTVCRKWKKIIEALNIIPAFLVASSCERIHPVRADLAIVVGDFRESEAKGDEFVCYDPESDSLSRLHLASETKTLIGALPQELRPFASGDEDPEGDSEEAAECSSSEERTDDGCQSKPVPASGDDGPPDGADGHYRARLSKLDFQQSGPTTIEFLTVSTPDAPEHSTGTIVIDVHTGAVSVNTPERDLRSTGPWFPAPHLKVERNPEDLNKLLVTDSKKGKTISLVKQDQYFCPNEQLQFFAYRHFLGIYASGVARQKCFFSFNLEDLDDQGAAKCSYSNFSWTCQFGLNFIIGTPYVTLDHNAYYSFETNSATSLPYEMNQTVAIWKNFVLRYEGPDPSEEDMQHHECWLRIYDIDQKLKRKENECAEETTVVKCVREFLLDMRDWECGALMFDGKYLSFRENGVRVRDIISFVFA